MYTRLIPNNTLGMMIGDFGCGQSLFYEKLKVQYPAPTFLDITMSSLRTIDYGLRINADIRSLPIRDEVYDIITCIGVIHHLPNMEPAFEEISRILKKDGLAIIGVYSPASIQAKIRKFYDYLSNKWSKNTVFWITELLVRLKTWNIRHRMTDIEIEKKAQDLLRTPIVHYLPFSYYMQLAQEANLKLDSIVKISSMVILNLVKHQK